ncbi:MAG: NTP transferase domain-containing protein, partial [Thioalkalivibrio sp.]|nr:NTP transferase domain-containing protein [Thioalkalivibrio sp.]
MRSVGGRERPGRVAVEDQQGEEGECHDDEQPRLVRHDSSPFRRAFGTRRDVGPGGPCRAQGVWYLRLCAGSVAPDRISVRALACITQDRTAWVRGSLAGPTSSDTHTHRIGASLASRHPRYGLIRDHIARRKGRTQLKAVVLAAGRGSRMRASAPGDPPLDAGQRAAADEGTKTLVPFHGHPLMSYILAALADEGVEQVCLVVGPGEDPVRRHYELLRTRRLRISFAVQDTPSGSAHALLAAEPFVGADPVLVVNGDNLYPSAVVRSICRLEGDGLAGFHAGALARDGGIPPG